MLQDSSPLRPRSPGGKLFVVAIGRISTVHQNHENIEASYRYVREYLGKVYDGPIDLRLLGEQGRNNYAKTVHLPRFALHDGHCCPACNAII